MSVTPEDRLAFLERFFRIACEMGSTDEFFYTTTGSVFTHHPDMKHAGVRIFANCNDLFEWACADAEEVTPENIGILEEAWADIQPLRKEYDKALDAWLAAGGAKQVPPVPWPPHMSGSDAITLFSCRVRKERPQGPCYQSIAPSLVPLIDACGPEKGAKRPYKDSFMPRGPTPENATPWTCRKCKEKP